MFPNPLQLFPPALRREPTSARTSPVREASSLVLFIRARLVPLILALAVLCLSPIRASLAGDLPNTPPEGWWWYYGQSADQLNALLTTNQARLVSIQVEQTSPLLFTAAMVKNSGEYAKSWWWYFGQSEAQINALAMQHNARVVNLDAYEEGGETVFAAIFISNTGADAKGWWWYFGQSPAQVGQLVTQHNARLIDLRQYGGGQTFAVVMVDNTGTDAVGWWWYYNVSAAQVSTFLQQNGAYLTSLQIAAVGSSTFNVVMDKLPTPGNEAWWWYYGETPWEVKGLVTYNEAWLRDVKTYNLDGRRVFTTVMLGLPRGAHAVTTYHYDNLRTGWNYNEPHLSEAAVASNEFALLHTIALDAQVDTQPLVVPGLESVGGKSTSGHDVAYVTTEANTVYAADASTGAVLAERNLGPAVPVPLNCNNNAPTVGINGTPVIDLGARTLYVVTYTQESGQPVHRLHALDITTLADKMASIIVKASHALSNGQTVTFDSHYQRQRAGLLEANGNIYVAFASYCDFQAGRSRGWVLGWNKSTLAALPHNELTDQLPPPTSNTSFLLSSIWMSGYGLAADSAGNIYAVTGNSGKGTYDSAHNVSESVIKLSADLSKLESFFTPSNVNDLDGGDVDYGSGGALLLPQQDGATPDLLGAVGKDGRLFVLNRDSLGGFTPGGPDKAVTMQQIDSCWCGPSYYMDPSGGVIVSSGGGTVTLWRVQTSSGVSLGSLGASTQLFAWGNQAGAVHDGGFFTTISSFGAQSDAVIWALSKDDNASQGKMYLNAFSPHKDASGHLTLLKRLQAGSWGLPTGNPNLVPVVANGHVFVASNRQLTIFGLQ
jgi:hypothetical protein